MKKQHWVYSFKKSLPFWPEAIFSLVFLITVIGNLVWSILNKSELDISFWITNLVLFGFVSCLIRQFFWKNLTLGLFLSIILGLGSSYMILAVLSEMSESAQTNGFMGLIFGLILFGTLMLAAIFMPIKYFSHKSNPER